VNQLLEHIQEKRHEFGTGERMYGLITVISEVRCNDNRTIQTNLG
jgi:hypothetical protein